MTSFVRMTRLCNIDSVNWGRFDPQYIGNAPQIQLAPAYLETYNKAKQDELRSYIDKITEEQRQE